ncbi:MAG: hypothetical protein ACI391_03015 [Muribaculaceae bacterium]
MNTLFVFALICISTLASIAQGWDVHQTIERGRVELVEDPSPNAMEDEWNSDNIFNGNYTLPTSIKTICFVDIR